MAGNSSQRKIHACHGERLKTELSNSLLIIVYGYWRSILSSTANPLLQSTLSSVNRQLLSAIGHPPSAIRHRPSNQKTIGHQHCQPPTANCQLFAPSMRIAHFYHHCQDIIPRLLFHEHFVRKHASVPTDM